MDFIVNKNNNVLLLFPFVLYSQSSHAGDDSIDSEKREMGKRKTKIKTKRTKNFV